MANWTEEELATFRERVAAKLAVLDERIVEYRELTKPIPPENAIGRVSRMDAINNRSINEAALRTAEKQKAPNWHANTVSKQSVIDEFATAP